MFLNLYIKTPKIWSLVIGIILFVVGLIIFWKILNYMVTIELVIVGGVALCFCSWGSIFLGDFSSPKKNYYLFSDLKEKKEFSIVSIPPNFASNGKGVFLIIIDYKYEKILFFQSHFIDVVEEGKQYMKYKNNIRLF